MSQSKRTWRRRIGRVTVYLRGNRYWIYYRQGKQVRQPVGTTKEEALALAAKINAQLVEGAPTILAFQPIAVTAMIAKWLDHHEHVRRSAVNTVNRYRTAIEHLTRFIEANHPGLRADRFDSGMAEQFVRHLRTAKISPNGCKGATKRTMRDKGVIFTLETSRALFNFARDQRHLPQPIANPFPIHTLGWIEVARERPAQHSYFVHAGLGLAGHFEPLAKRGIALLVGEAVHGTTKRYLRAVEDVLTERDSLDDPFLRPRGCPLQFRGIDTRCDRSLGPRSKVVARGLYEVTISPFEIRRT